MWEGRDSRDSRDLSDFHVICCFEQLTCLGELPWGMKRTKTGKTGISSPQNDFCISQTGHSQHQVRCPRPRVSRMTSALKGAWPAVDWVAGREGATLFLPCAARLLCIHKSQDPQGGALRFETTEILRKRPQCLTASLAATMTCRCRKVRFILTMGVDSGS